MSADDNIMCADKTVEIENIPIEKLHDCNVDVCNEICLYEREHDDGIAVSSFTPIPPCMLEISFYPETSDEQYHTPVNIEAKMFFSERLYRDDLSKVTSSDLTDNMRKNLRRVTFLTHEDPCCQKQGTALQEPIRVCNWLNRFFPVENESDESDDESTLEDDDDDFDYKDLDKIVIDGNDVVKVNIDYPLQDVFSFDLRPDGGVTKRQLIDFICLTYRKIYDDEEKSMDNTKKNKIQDTNSGKASGCINRPQSSGTYGIWGHILEDLFIEGISYNKPTRTVELSMGS